MNSTNIVLVIVILLAFWMFFVYSQCYNPIIEQEHLTGYGVISGLAFNNNTGYCSPGNDRGWSGGCFVPHRVIV